MSQRLNDGRDTLVIYHANCWDGFCSAWVASLAHLNIELFPAHYGSKPPDCAGRDVLILDFCYPLNESVKIGKEADSLTIIDHHPTAAETLWALKDVIPSVKIVFEVGKSGARLTWNTYFPLIATDGGTVERKAPWLVDYTEDRDLWLHTLPNSREINAALRSYPLDLDVWNGLRITDPDEMAREGEAILRAEGQIVEQHVRNASELTIAGHPVLCVNATVLHSEIAGALSIGRVFGAAYFIRKDGMMQFSLRSEDIGMDVSIIAKMFGGGGHRNAAGFEIPVPESMKISR